MKKEILEYIQSQRIGVFAVEMLDGSPHGATVHFAHTEEPRCFYFETAKSYRKAEPIQNKGQVRATLVVGSDESNMKTLQLDGYVSLLDISEENDFKKLYFGKFPEKIGKSYGDTEIYFKFVPKWWRYTDWNTPNGKEITVSE